MRSVYSMGVAALAAFVIAGCVDSARIKSADEEMLVDQKKAGTIVYQDLSKRTLEKLLAVAHQKVVRENQKKFLVAFIGIDNKGAEELGDHEAATYDQVDEVLVNSGYFDVVSKRFVDAARREAQIRNPDELFLQNGKDRFMSVLAREGQIPDYLLWGNVTTQTSEHKGLMSKTKERVYRFSMELIDAHRGTAVAKQSEESQKLYTNW